MAKLLIVEDDTGVRTTIVNFLELEGYAVDAVASSDEALERLRQNAYPIVISDIYIDGRTGLDVLDAARRKDPTCSVILMTARGTMETVMAATRGGAFDYIAKPFDLDRMLETVKRAEALRHDRAHAARKRAVRRAQGRLHGGRPRPCRRIRGSEQGNRFSGRDRRYRVRIS